MDSFLQTWQSLAPTHQWLISATLGTAFAALVAWLIHRSKRQVLVREHEQTMAALLLERDEAESQSNRLRDEKTNLDIELARMQEQQRQVQMSLSERMHRIEQQDASLKEAAEAREQSQKEVADLKADKRELLERLEQERKQSKEKLITLAEAEKRLSDAFKALSSRTLEDNNKQFLDLAKATLEKYQEGAQKDLTQRQQNIEQLTKPINERLEKFDGKLNELEKQRVGAYENLNAQVKNLMETQIPQLHAETSKLVKALRQPHARGRWGEVQLKRVVEMAGMLEHCDFVEQASTDTEEGRLRPDMLVNLPGGGHIVVDAKAPVDAYLNAVEAENEDERQLQLARHASQVKKHITDLGRKSYHAQFDFTPEFVVLFVPGEAFFSAALSYDLELIEYGAGQKVIPASPTTLIALLKAVAYGWQQEALAKNAKEIAELGKTLYERIQKLAEHWDKVGSHLDKAINSYNQSVGSLETRILVTARQFPALAGKEEGDIKEPMMVDKRARALSAEELLIHDSGKESS